MTDRPQQILIAGDGPTLNDCKKSLNKYFEVFTASGYEEATSILDHQPQIRVLIVEPGGSRAQLVGYCGRERPGVAVLLMVRQKDPAMSAALGYGKVFRVLTKPVGGSELRNAVQEAIEAYPMRGVRPVADGGQDREPAMVRDVAMEPVQCGKKPDAHETELRLKDEWMRVVAHDIRSPLSIINGYAAFLLENEIGLSPQGADVVGRIRNTGQRLLNLLNNILTLASLEEGKVVLECAPCRLSETLDAVMDNLRGLAESSKIRLTGAVKGADPAHNLDHIMIEQVLQNLVANAIKFTDPGGSVHLSGEKQPEGVVFSVRDTGCGLTPEQIQHIFDKFSRFSSTNHEGSGLGLAIAKALVHLHGGRIWVESQPDKGSTFYFSVLPQPETTD